MKKIAVIASSRATYGYKRKIISMIEKSQKLKLQLIVTGMHLLPEYGMSIKEIEQDGYPISAKVDMILGGDSPAAWSKSIGIGIQGLAQTYSMLNPDLVLVSGDRAEMFAATITAAYMNIPIAHIQAGDVSGHIDGNTRHAITKLAHIHLASCEDSAQRVIKLGEEPWRVHDVGAPQLDEIIHGKKLSVSEIKDKTGIDVSKPTLILIQHPLLIEEDRAYAQTKETMEALKAFEMQTVVIYPNIDAGGKESIRAIREYENLPFVHTFRNIDRAVFYSILEKATAIVGNSSCGILEAPSFKLPAINIGDRQRGRMRACNVIDVEVNKDSIASALNLAINDKKFREKLNNCKNPYGDGKSSERIISLLESIEINEKLIDKKITY